MTEMSARLALPFLLPGQAQKEFFHNEALARIDVTLCAAVEGAPSAVMPAAPEPGQSWIVAAGASGAWSGQDDHLACWTSGGWRFVAPVEGMLAWNKADGLYLFWNGNAWSTGEWNVSRLIIEEKQIVGPRLSALPVPAGGGVIDVEARVAIDAICAALKTHGLTD